MRHALKPRRVRMASAGWLRAQQSCGCSQNDCPERLHSPASGRNLQRKLSGRTARATGQAGCRVRTRNVALASKRPHPTTLRLGLNRCSSRSCVHTRVPDAPKLAAPDAAARPLVAVVGRAGVAASALLHGAPLRSARRTRELRQQPRARHPAPRRRRPGRGGDQLHVRGVCACCLAAPPPDARAAAAQLAHRHQVLYCGC